MTARANPDLLETGRLAQVSMLSVHQHCKQCRIAWNFGSLPIQLIALLDRPLNNNSTLL